MDELKRLRREAKADAERVARGELPAFRTGSGAEVHAGPEAKRQVDRDLADVLPVAVDNFLRHDVLTSKPAPKPAPEPTRKPTPEPTPEPAPEPALGHTRVCPRAALSARVG